MTFESTFWGVTELWIRLYVMWQANIDKCGIIHAQNYDRLCTLLGVCVSAEKVYSLIRFIV